MTGKLLDVVKGDGLVIRLRTLCILHEPKQASGIASLSSNLECLCIKGITDRLVLYSS